MNTPRSCICGASCTTETAAWKHGVCAACFELLGRPRTEPTWNEVEPMIGGILDLEEAQQKEPGG